MIISCHPALISDLKLLLCISAHFHPTELEETNWLGALFARKVIIDDRVSNREGMQENLAEEGAPLITRIFTYETALEHHIDEVWPLFTSADNLISITKFPKISILSDPSTVKGNRLQLVLNFGLFCINWHLIIREVEEKAFFVDEALHVPFPFRSWRHTHTFVQQGDCTLMRDQIEFKAYLPAFMVRIVLRRMFMDREKAIKTMLRR